MSAKEPVDGLSASVQLLPLPAGVYLFSVKTGKPHLAGERGPIKLPAVHVGPAPGTAAHSVQCVSKNDTQGNWLAEPGDFLVLRLAADDTTLLVTSLRDSDGAVLSINAERLDTRFESATEAATATSTPSIEKTLQSKGEALATVDLSQPEAIVGLPLEITAHIRNHGDQSFVRRHWAGRLGTGMWLESFAVQPLERFGKKDLEYKGLTASGFETPWLSDFNLCGTQGMGVPLIGFAVRLKPSAKTAGYDCEYSGYFQSGALVGTLKNGAPCRSTVANDPLEGVQIRLIERGSQTTRRVDTPSPVAKPVEPAAGRPTSATAVTPKPSPKKSALRSALNAALEKVPLAAAHVTRSKR
jgi:hypothetical protein